MPSLAKSYPDWKAPAPDGEILLWPASRQLCDDVVANQKRLSAADTRVQNVSLSEVRRRQREWLGHDDDQPFIADGHQTELYHPGVWAKTALGDGIATRLGGAAYHIAVDTDSPKHLQLRWVGGSMPITDDPRVTSAHWTGEVDAPSPAHLAELERRLAAAGFDSASTIMQFVSSLRRLALEQPKLPAALTNACHELDWQLGLRHHALLESPMLLSEPYLVFAHHIAARAGAFAASYNRTLAAYRRKEKIRSVMRPMPDLAAFEDSVELPFWLDDLTTGARMRPSVFVGDSGYVLSLKSGAEFYFDPAVDGWDASAKLLRWLRQNRVRLGPRALTLTMYLRLFVADQFIHGIGGARYDQVTDAIIADHFAIQPPAFCVTTATMYLPQALGRTRVCVRCVLQEGHRLRHSLLGDRKRDYVEKIAAAPRGSTDRFAAFAEMHRELAGAIRTHPALKKWEESLRDAEVLDAEESILFDRELFYALQPRERLMEMIERYRSTITT